MEWKTVWTFQTNTAMFQDSFSFVVVENDFAFLQHLVVEVSFSTTPSHLVPQPAVPFPGYVWGLWWSRTCGARLLRFVIEAFGWWNTSVGFQKKVTIQRFRWYNDIEVWSWCKVVGHKFLGWCATAWQSWNVAAQLSWTCEEALQCLPEWPRPRERSWCCPHQGKAIRAWPGKELQQTEPT